MPLTLKALRAKTITVEVEVLGETVHLGFAPGRYTSAVDERLDVLMSSIDPDAKILTAPQNAGIRAFVLALLVEWDVLDDDGNPLPIDDENLRQIPPPILLQFMGALSEANQPDPPTAPPSDGSSNMEPTSSAPSPTGT